VLPRMAECSSIQGNAGLGTAGAGDTLTASLRLMAQDVATLRKKKADALNSTIAGLYVGGLAGILPQVNWECAQWWRQTYVSISVPLSDFSTHRVSNPSRFMTDS